jgi:hypothetical protein
MDDVALIDLHHMGRPEELGVCLVPGLEPPLVDCGPASCLLLRRRHRGPDRAHHIRRRGYPSARRRPRSLRRLTPRDRGSDPAAAVPGALRDRRGRRDLARMRAALARWSGWVCDGATEAEFIARATAEQAGLEPEAARALEAAADFRPSYAGLARYWASRCPPRSRCASGSLTPRSTLSPPATTSSRVSVPSCSRVRSPRSSGGGCMSRRSP